MLLSIMKKENMKYENMKFVQLKMFAPVNHLKTYYLM